MRMASEVLSTPFGREPVPKMNDDDPNAPADGKDGFDCPRCGAFAHQTWNSLRIAQHPFTDTKSGGGAYAVRTGHWRTSQCAKCTDFTVWRDNRIMYPAGAGSIPLPHDGMPSKAREIYEEAREVWPISPRAGAALARASLESILKELDPEAGKVDLATRIDRMRDKVSPELGDMLTVIRHAGNKSLHVEDQPDDVMVLILDPAEIGIAELIFESINDLVEERITRPAKKRALFERVPEDIRKNVGKKTPKAE